MKRARLHLPPGGVHPVYRLLTDSPHVERSEGIHWNVTEDGTLTMIHRLVGDLETVTARLEGIERVLEYEVLATVETSDGSRSNASRQRSDGNDESAGTAFVFVRDEGTDDSRTLFRSFDREGVVVVPPIEYDGDGASFTLVGEDRAIQRSLEAIPDRFDVAVERVGDPARAIGSTDDLSDRQREAARVGVELGYFDVPRRASHEAVASELGCSPSTAAEHLQKAQSKLVRAAFEDE